MIDYDKRILGDLFSNPIKGESESSFNVPRFQRKYEWEKENEVLRLGIDVFDSLGQTYFMGPVIFCQEELGSRQVVIIDGQQRLVTFAIFYRALADYIQRRRNEGAFVEDLRPHVEKLQNDLKSKIIRGWMKKREPVLHLSKVINRFFRERLILDEDADKIEKLRIRSKDEHPSEKRLREAYVKIYDLLAERFDSETGEQLLSRLSEVGDSLIFRQIFLSITVQDYSNAFTIFETMNERGKRLTLSDLVKNLCFRKMQGLGEELLDEFEDDWDKVDLLVSDFGLFLWHVWVSRFGTCPRRKVFTAVEEQTKKMNENEIFGFSSAMIFDEAQWYHTYENPQHEFEITDEVLKERMRYLRLLKSMGATRCYPLLLGIDYAEKKGKAITDKQVNELLKTLTCLTFWHSGVCEKDAKELEKTYHNLAQQLRKLRPEESSKNLPTIINTLIDKFPSNSECWGSFSTRAFTDEGFVKMALREIESAENPGEKTLATDKVVWLEHILPRKPKSDSVWVEIFKDESERKEYTYKIGNCTLLLDRLNEKARNLPFSKKKELYAKSHVQLTQDLTKLEKWDTSAINQRTEQLFNLAKKVWPIYSEQEKIGASE